MIGCDHVLSVPSWWRMCECLLSSCCFYVKLVINPELGHRYLLQMDVLWLIDLSVLSEAQKTYWYNNMIYMFKVCVCVCVCVCIDRKVTEKTNSKQWFKQEGKKDIWFNFHPSSPLSSSLSSSWISETSPGELPSAALNDLTHWLGDLPVDK